MISTKTAGSGFQLVYGKLSTKESKSCEGFRHKFLLKEAGFMEDVFMLVKSKGLKLMARTGIKRLLRRTKSLDMRDAIENRYDFLLALKKIPLFHKLCDMADEYSVEEAVDRLLALIRAAYKRHQQAVCKTCPNQGQCGAARSSGQTGTPAGSCPSQLQPDPNGNLVPAGGAQQMMQVGAAFIGALLHAAMIGIAGQHMPAKMVKALIAGGGEGFSHNVDYYDTSFTGAQMMQSLEELVQKLTDKDLIVFNLARILDDKIEKKDKGEVTHSQTPSSKLVPQKMQSMAEVTRLTAGSHALPQVLKNYRMGTKQLQVIEHQMPDMKKQCMYCLVDTSGSMDGEVAPNKYGMVSKGHVATALVLAIIKKVMQEKSVLYFRFFAGNVDILHTAKKVEDLAHISRLIAMCNYNGGGTNITTALKTAFEDIQQGQKDLAKSEVVLISDAEDQVDSAALKKSKQHTTLHTLEILSGSSGHNGAARSELKTLSTTYVEVDSANVDLEKIAKVVPK